MLQGRKAADVALTRWFRRHRRYLLAGLVVMLMISWGILTTLSSLLRPQSAPLGSIRGEPVDQRDLHDAGRTLQVALNLGMADARTIYLLQLGGAPVHVQAALTVLSEALGDFVFEEGARANDPEAAWRFLALWREAEADGIKVTNEELRETILYFPALQDENAFSAANYRAFLRMTGLSDEEMVACVSRLAKVAKLLCLRRGTIGSSRAELWMSYAHDREQMRVNYVAVDSSLFLPLVEPTDEQLNAFYDEHKEVLPDPASGGIGYMAPERVRVEYALAPLEELAAEAEVSEQEIVEYYGANKGEFLKETPAPEDEDGAGEASEAEEGTAEPEYSDLSEVRAEIRSKLARQKARDKAIELVGTVQRELGSMADQFPNEPQPLQQMARRYALEYQLARTPSGGELLTRQELVTLVPEGTQMAEFAFAEDLSTYYPRTILSGEQPVIYQVLERRDPEPLPLEEVRGTVRQDYAQREALKKAAVLGQKLKELAVEVGFEQAVETMNQRLSDLLGSQAPSADDEAAAWPLTVERSELFSRDSRYAGGIDEFVPNVMKAAFELGDMEVAAATEGPPVSRCYVIRPAQRQEASGESFGEAAPMYRPAYVYRKQNQVMLEWMRGLLKTAHRSQKVAG